MTSLCLDNSVEDGVTDLEVEGREEAEGKGIGSGDMHLEEVVEDGRIGGTEGTRGREEEVISDLVWRLYLEKKDVT